MKIILGIFGTTIGTIAVLAFVNFFYYGAQTNVSALLCGAIVMGLFNGVAIAVQSYGNGFDHSSRSYALAGAAGMGILYLVLIAVLCVVFESRFIMPTLGVLAFRFLGMMAVGAVSGLSYRIAAGVR